MTTILKICMVLDLLKHSDNYTILFIISMFAFGIFCAIFSMISNVCISAFFNVPNSFAVIDVIRIYRKIENM